MKAISNYDTIAVGDRVVLAFDVHRLLQLLGDAAIGSDWRLVGLECSGETAESLHHLSDSGTHISGEELTRLTRQTLQTIEGEYQGFRPGEDDPWITIRAVDSSCFDVECEDPRVLKQLAAHFNDVREWTP